MLVLLLLLMAAASGQDVDCDSTTKEVSTTQAISSSTLQSTRAADITTVAPTTTPAVSTTQEVDCGCMSCMVVEGETFYAAEVPGDTCGQGCRMVKVGMDRSGNNPFYVTCREILRYVYVLHL
jgi:hypothetical protein